MGALIVPTLCVGMHPMTLCVTSSRADAERPERHSHAERGNDHLGRSFFTRVAQEIALIFPAELRRTLIPHAMRRLRHPHAFDQ